VNAPLFFDRPPVRIRDCRHGTFAYLLGDEYVSVSLDRLGEFSEGEVEAFRAALTPGAVAVDVGANIGALTVPMAQFVGPSGVVIAFEPQRVLFQLLCANLALNGLLNVQAHQAAVGAVPGIVEMPAFDYARSGNFGGVMLAGHIRTSDGGTTEALRESQPAPVLAAPIERVPVRPLDELELPRVDILKIDVEGMELDVIAGADATIRRCRPVLMVENDRDIHSPAVIQALLDRDYRLFWFLVPLWRQDNYRQNPENPWPEAVIVSANVLAVPSELRAVTVGLREITSPASSWRE
jgi:FkbM family methyltransferase